MSHDLKIFNNPEFGHIRLYNNRSETWWALKDVCDALDMATPAKVAAWLGNNEVTHIHLTDENGRQQKALVVNERGLYKVIIQSDKPSAKRFMRWVCHEILPHTKSDGICLMEGSAQEAILHTDTLRMKSLIKRYQKKIKKQKQMIAELKSKADYADMIIKSEGTVTIQQIAKEYGMSAVKLNQILRELGIQYKQSGQWLLYYKYQDKGYTNTEIIPITRSDGSNETRLHTKWTHKGRLFLMEVLSRNNIRMLNEENKQVKNDNYQI